MQNILSGSLCAFFIAGCANSALPDLDDAHRDYTGALPVFPGAEGFGTDTKAGRGGAVLIVDTLANEGPGSLRWALEQRGPRTIVFAVGGVIDSPAWLELHEPFVTIAGQTAPEPGITIFGAGLSIQTHDVLVQHVSIRAGDREDGPDADDRDALQIVAQENGSKSVNNIVIDHVSLSWGIDESFSTWYPGVRDVTVSNCLIAESLDESLKGPGHSKAFLIGDHTRRLAMLRNVLAHSDDRNPIMKGDTTALVVNNFIYDPGRWPVSLIDAENAGPMLTSLQGNDFVYGPSSQADHQTVLVHKSVKRGTKLHLDGNRAWDLKSDQASLLFTEQGAAAELVSQTPVSVKPLSLLPVEGLEGVLLRTAGSRPAVRNAVDQRIIDTITTRTGQIIDRVEQVGFTRPEPTMRPVALPDDPTGDSNGDGYTNLEGWLHAQSAAAENP